MYEIKKDSDNLHLYETDIQSISLDKFTELEENDILFIDSSHVCKPGSDVSLEIFEILPILKKGVIIHFYDMFWPMEYPYKWVTEGRAYNELFLIRAFLMNNSQYEILLFGDQLRRQKCKFPEGMLNCGVGSLWIRKIE